MDAYCGRCGRPHPDLGRGDACPLCGGPVVLGLHWSQAARRQQAPIIERERAGARAKMRRWAEKKRRERLGEPPEG